jgi:DNA (cytosine-5)-methyltransferase 1
VINGVTPVWASEIEDAPISITKRHFPNMEHLGNITKINGTEIIPVDIITFGSPCQDLSIAGKRKGLEGERSGLFLEAVRIIKEMRKKTNGKYPSRIIWENVPGAFSSNAGEDFRIVLQEIATIIGGGGDSIPRPAQGEGNAVWFNAGAVVGDSWSIAWRVLDAQYWGVPQRRRRIFLVADFTGQCAAEILFKPDSLHGNSAERGKKGEETAGNAESGVSKAIGVDGHNQNLTGDIVNTLKGGRVDKDNIGLVILNDRGGSNLNVEKSDIAPCLRSETHGNLPIVFEPGAVSRIGGHWYQGSPVGSLRANMGDNQFAIVENHPCDSRIKLNKDGVVQTLSSRMGTGGGNVPLLLNTDRSAVYCMEAKQQAQSIEVDLSPPIMAKEPNCVFSFNDNYLIRRLTPLECERLQGFPDGWTEYGHDGRKISDSARYKALGNSLALPCVEFVLRRISEVA